MNLLLQAIIHLAIRSSWWRFLLVTGANLDQNPGRVVFSHSDGTEEHNRDGVIYSNPQTISWLIVLLQSLSTLTSILPR